MYKQDKTRPPEEQKISGIPDITVTPLDKTKDTFVVMGCDGIWERYSNQQMVDFVRERAGSLVETPMPYSAREFEKFVEGRMERVQRQIFIAETEAKEREDGGGLLPELR